MRLKTLTPARGINESHNQRERDLVDNFAQLLSAAIEVKKMMQADARNEVVEDIDPEGFAQEIMNKEWLAKVYETSLTSPNAKVFLRYDGLKIIVEFTAHLFWLWTIKPDTDEKPKPKPKAVVPAKPRPKLPRSNPVETLLDHEHFAELIQTLDAFMEATERKPVVPKCVLEMIQSQEFVTKIRKLFDQFGDDEWPIKRRS